MEALRHKSLVKTLIEPAHFADMGNGGHAVDFGKCWFGTLRANIDSPRDHARAVVRLGELLDGGGRIDREPSGTARFREMEVSLRKGRHTYELVILPDTKNTGRRTIKMPAHIGEVLPFRYAEMEGIPGSLAAGDVRMVAVHYPFDEHAAHFESSDDCLNRIWELCRHTMVATSFCGMFVDGDRERYPREADAYINQLGTYCIDAEYGLARHTHEFMMHNASVWTEWLFHSIFTAWADFMYTGDDTSVRRLYPDLQAKLLLPLAREDGLICTKANPLPHEFLRTIYRDEGEHINPGSEGILRDLVDWPAGERDGYEMCDLNTVVNAFHYRALVRMGDLAAHIGDGTDADGYRERAARVQQSFQEAFYNTGTGLFVDGECSTHSSLHANLFPLAFGLVGEEQKPSVFRFIEQKGMACSVYAAQYLLEALFREGRADAAIALMTANGDRSWKHMLDGGATITWEAWDVKYKLNMDRNHAWGAAPANILPRCVLGVQPLTPGADTVSIAPQPGSLEFVRGKVPTRHGPILVDYTAKRGRPKLEVEIPAGVTAEVNTGGEPTRTAGPGRHTFAPAAKSRKR